MKHKRFALSLLLLFAVFSLAGTDGKDTATTWRGEIADNQCALNIHSLTRSHQEMIKSKEVGGNATSCTLYCVRHMTGYLVLSVKNDAYRLDDQALAENFAGQKVKVTGTLDPKNNTIHMTKIEADE